MKTTKKKSSLVPVHKPTRAPIARSAIDVPSSETIDRWLADFDALVLTLGSYTKALSTAERRREAKIRTGGERYVATIVEAALRYGLSFPGGPGDIEANLALVEALMPVLARLRAVSEIVSDTILRGRGAAWRGTTSAYTMLTRLAKNNPVLAVDMQHARAFFARRHKPRNGPSAAAESTKSEATDAE